MAWADEADLDQLMCRDTGIRHRWDPLNAVRQGREFVETLVCGRCGTTKTRRLTSSGLIKGGTKFAYADGYVRKGEGRVTKAENAKIRMKSLKRRYGL